MNSPSALLQLYLPLRLTTWLQWIGQKDNYKTRRETIKFGDLVRLILDVWWKSFTGIQRDSKAMAGFNSVYMQVIVVKHFIVNSMKFSDLKSQNYSFLYWNLVPPVQCKVLLHDCHTKQWSISTPWEVSILLINQYLPIHILCWPLGACEIFEIMCPNNVSQ